jgi:hypothetical protein
MEPPDRVPSASGRLRCPQLLDSAALTRGSRLQLGVELPSRVLTRQQIIAAGARLDEPSESTRPFPASCGGSVSSRRPRPASQPLSLHGRAR